MIHSRSFQLARHRASTALTQLLFLTTMLHGKDLVSTRQATTLFPWCMDNAPHNYHICHLLLIQPEPDNGPHLYLHLLSEPPYGGYPLPPLTYSADRADVHCLGVVAGVEQAISLQQHREACLDKAGRDERSDLYGAPGMWHPFS